MIKKLILCAFLVLSTVLVTREATMPTPTTILPEVVIVGKSIQCEIFDALVEGRDSVLVRNGHDTLYVDVEPLDSVMAKIVLAQAIFESGSFQSPLARLHFNVYGMMHPGKGKLTTSLGPYARAEGRNGYASYTSAENSAIDLVLLLDFYKVPHNVKTVDQYVRLIKKKNYFTSSAVPYAAGLNYYLQHDGYLLQITIRQKSNLHKV